MSVEACKEHFLNPVKGYNPCPGCEVERLRAELAGLRTGFDAQNEVIAGLRAQVNIFRRAVAWAIQIHKDPELSHEIPNREWLDDLDAAMGKVGE